MCSANTLSKFSRFKAWVGAIAPDWVVAICAVLGLLLSVINILVTTFGSTETDRAFSNMDIVARVVEGGNIEVRTTDSKYWKIKSAEILVSLEDNTKFDTSRYKDIKFPVKLFEKDGGVYEGVLVSDAITSDICVRIEVSGNKCSNFDVSLIDIFVEFERGGRETDVLGVENISLQ